MIWHSESTAAVVTQLQTDRARGLSTQTAVARRQEAGENRILHTKQQSFLRRAFDRLKQPAVLVLVAVALVTLAIDLYRQFSGSPQANWWESAAVLVLAVLRCLLSVAGDDRARRTQATLEPLAEPTVCVWRDGTQVSLLADQLVPGDILEVSEGDRIPADCRLLESVQLRCDESPLTGDPLPAQKDAAAEIPSITPLNERVNMLYATCTVVHGQGRAVVVETGVRTEAGKAAALRPQKPNAALPLQKGLARMAHTLTLPVLLLSAAILVLAWLTDLPFLSALLLAAAFAVAVLPEELPSFVPAALAPGIRRMARMGVVVRRPEAVEALGQVSVLCSDKTGSFTQNHMTLVRAFVGDHMVKLDDNRMPDDVSTLIQLAALCTDSHIQQTDEGAVATGDPTEAAIVSYALRHGMNKEDLSNAYPRLGEVPFDADRRRMTAIHLVEGRHVVIVKGAPEGLLPLCTRVPDAARDAEEFMEAGALRVLAVAYKTIDEAPAHCFADELEQGLTFLGLLGLTDPPQPEALAAVADCRTAGIRPVMLTGDGLTTSAAVAKRLGLLDSPEEAVSGDTLAAMTNEEMQREGPQFHVCARVAPADKVRIITAWQQTGAVVAVTGDSTADIPALRTANVGCAMHRNGNDTAVAVADVVLTDDRFSTLVAAVRESRALFADLRKMLQYWVARHLGAALLIPAALIGWGEIPLTPLRLLWLSLVAGVLPMLALGAEPAGRCAMRRPPRAKNEGLLTGRAGAAALLAGLLLGALALLPLTLDGGALERSTMSFAVLALGELGLILCLRSSLPFWQSRPLHAPGTWGALAAGLALLLIPLLTPSLRELCGLAALTGTQWGIVALLALIPVAVSEAIKMATLLLRRNRTA